jgi:hypothetical protein
MSQIYAKVKIPFSKSGSYSLVDSYVVGESENVQNGKINLEKRILV